MKKLIFPFVAVLLVVGLVFAIAAFTTTDVQSTFMGVSDKECPRTAMAASGKECGENVTSASLKTAAGECGDASRVAMVSGKDECGATGVATTVAEIVCPHSGAVMKVHTEKATCDENTKTLHASGEENKDKAACCEKHAVALAE